MTPTSRVPPCTGSLPAAILAVVALMIVPLPPLLLDLLLSWTSAWRWCCC